MISAQPTGALITLIGPAKSYHLPEGPSACPSLLARRLQILPTASGDWPEHGQLCLLASWPPPVCRC